MSSIGCYDLIAILSESYIPGKCIVIKGRPLLAASLILTDDFALLSVIEYNSKFVQPDTIPQ
jgi:hypothetical protein